MTTLVQFLKTDSSNGNKYYIKREDLLPFSFGGNKARKAILFFEEIDRGKYECVITYGSSSSNHCRIVANMAKKRNIPCYVISPEETDKETFNKKIMRSMNVTFITVPVNEVALTIDKTIKELKEKKLNPYFIPGGGHGNLGTQAYIDCYKEIREFEEKMNTQFDYIFFASGTGTTQSGLVCGKILEGGKAQIIGISIARKNPRGKNIILDSEKEYLNCIGFNYSEKQLLKETIFIDKYIDDGYGKTSEEIKSTIINVLQNYGIALDETYTGKAFLGMEKYIEEKEIKNSNILFIHTGGTPLFFDYISSEA